MRALLNCDANLVGDGYPTNATLVFGRTVDIYPVLSSKGSQPLGEGGIRVSMAEEGVGLSGGRHVVHFLSGEIFVPSSRLIEL
jgi:hypothetical protein